MMTRTRRNSPTNRSHAQPVCPFSGYLSACVTPPLTHRAATAHPIGSATLQGLRTSVPRGQQCAVSQAVGVIADLGPAPCQAHSRRRGLIDFRQTAISSIRSTYGQLMHRLLTATAMILAMTAAAIVAATLLSVHSAEARPDDLLPHPTDPNHSNMFAPQTTAVPWRISQWTGPWVDRWTGRWGH
jgi:hypothetical protein